MSSLTIYKENYAGSTAISNRFIDEYLAGANDAQIKVYLYLVRMMSANLPTGISDMADKFNHTEKDILRALKYWENNHLIALEYNESKVLSGIRFLSPSIASAEAERPMAPIVPLKLVTQEAEPVSVEVSAKAPEPEKNYNNFSYSKDELKSFKENTNILFIAESYLKRQLSSRDTEILYFIHKELNFTEALVDYLLQYCLERDKKSFSYIKTVAIAWAEEGVKTPKQAKALATNTYDKSVYSVLKSLGRTSSITPTEAAMVTKWIKEFSLPIEVINEACARTVLATDSHRLEYCDKILSSWKSHGVKSLSDVESIDASFKKPKATAAPRNSFNQMIHTDYDFDELERKLLSN